MTVDWSLCHWPACIEECRDGPKIDCPAVLAWREKKDDTMPDISKEAVERLAKTADLFAKAMKAFQHHTKKHNEDVRDTLRAQAARIAELEAALGLLCFEVSGLAAFEWDVRHAIGNTNFSCINTRLESAKALLAKDTSHDG